MAVFTAITAALTPILGAALASTVVQVGVGLALSAVASLFQKKPTMPRQEVQAVISQADAPRKVCYGPNRLGGVRAFFEADTNGVLRTVVVYHQGAISTLSNWVVDGEKAGIDGNRLTLASTNLNGKIRVAWRNGTDADYPSLQSVFPGLWTAEHKLTGLVTGYIQMLSPKPEDFSKIFPRGAQTSIQMDVEGKAVLDPRDNVARYTDNPGPCIRDYMISADGMRVPEAAMDDAQWAVFSDICDEAIPLKDGGTQPRYRLAGAYSLEDEPATVIAEMLAACDGGIYLTTEGKIAPVGGKYSEPDVTITEDDILEIEWGTGRNPMTAFNVLKGMYISADHDFTEVEAPERRDETLLVTQGERTNTLNVPWCPDGYQMQRLMKSYAYRAQPPRAATITTTLVGIKARFPKGDGVHSIRIEAGAFSGVFEVLDHAYSIADGTCTIAVQSLEDVWAWDAATEESPLAPANYSYLAAGGAIPEGLTASLEIVDLDQAGTQGGQIVAQVTDPGRDDLELRADYTRVDGSAGYGWRAMSVATGTRKATSGVLAEGSYVVRVYWAGQGVDSADYPTASISVVSNPTAPAAPTELAAVDSAGTVTVSWRNPDTDYYRTRVYRGTTNIFADATQIATVKGMAGETDSYDDAPGTGTWYYWVDAQNASLVASAETGPVSVTV